MRQPTTCPTAGPAHAMRVATGTVEYAIADTLGRATSRPRKVTGLLAAMFETIDGAPASPDLVRSLSAGSREWLLQRAAAAFRPGETWYESRCERCDAPYDLSCALDALPVKHPGTGFPVVTVPTSRGGRTFEVPNGTHEEELASAGLDAEAARRRLLELIALDDDAAAFVQSAPDEDLDRIDLALEDVAAESAVDASCVCPSCGEPTSARIDPLLFAFPRVTDLLRDVHVIASAYHWRQHDILCLGSARRRSYLELIRTGGRFAA